MPNTPVPAADPGLPEKPSRRTKSVGGIKLSPHTAPGTKVICVDVRLRAYDLNPRADGDLDGLTAGRVYTVLAIRQYDLTKSMYVAELAEVERPINRMSNRTGLRGFDIARFRYAELPRCLTDLLVAKHQPKLLRQPALVTGGANG